MKDKILELVKEYHIQNKDSKSLDETYRVSGASFSSDDIQTVVSAVLDEWFTEGKFSRDFRAEICRFTGTRHSVLVNSGSSANLLAVTAIKDLYKDNDGYYVVTCATAFPTTVTPLIQNGYVPWFVDIDPLTLQYDEEEILELIKKPEVRGVMLAHTLGIPFLEKKIADACHQQGKWLISDCCDALGANTGGEHVGYYADAGTLSFFPAHHITTGEGGAVFTNSAKLFRLMQQYANWGRDCYCLPGDDNTCNKRFEWEWENLPDKYDHKYVFTKLGYNLKMTDIQAALGLSQIRRVLSFIKERKNIYNKISRIMKPYEGLYLYTIPLTPFMSPFGFYILCANEDMRKELVQVFESNKISTRPVFSGNILRHPMMNKVAYKQSTIIGSDVVMKKGFWVGCWQGVTDRNLNTLEKLLKEYIYG